MAYERTYNCEWWSYAIMYVQKIPCCNAHCAKWLKAAVGGSSGSDSLRHIFSKTVVENHFARPMARVSSSYLSNEMTEELATLQKNLGSAVSDEKTWAYIQEGLHFQVTPNIRYPTAYQGNILSGHLKGYNYALVGWLYSSNLRVTDQYQKTGSRNHQSAMFRRENFVHYFDPAVGYFLIPEEKFENFFSVYFADTIANELHNTRTPQERLKNEGGFSYDQLEISGIKAT